MTRTPFRIMDENADTGPLPFEEEGDGRPWVIFTQQKEDGPHVYAGWVDAMDAFTALYFAREHFGQDRECLSLWAISGDHVLGTDLPDRPDKPGAERGFVAFLQPAAGDWYATARDVKSRVVHAKSAAAAQKLARETIDEAGTIHGIWVVAEEHIEATGEKNPIWRHVSQDYRMARGYAKPVRELWEAVRAEREIDDYQQYDLKETF